ncbi:MAG: MBL fold metallo-hydrolase [Dehalococcoidia bacterium]|nr:MBL fold metallo-hydrolase [Dehalococcoidia bacterium]
MPEMKISFLGTGSGTSTNRAHTAIVYDCDDGTRLLIDTSSGNSVARGGSELGIPVESFDKVLISHHHPDHLSGLLFVQFVRALERQDAPPLEVYITGESLDWAIKMCATSHLNVAEVDHEGATNSDGRQVMRWIVVEPGEEISLGPTTTASCFPADHISGAVGWKVNSDGMSVVFSGDTRFNPELVKASNAARLLIHEAFRTDEEIEVARTHGHSTAGDAGRAASQAGVAELVITHLDSAFDANPQPLIDDAKKHYSGPTSAANDLYQITISAP